jgi:hypothetical protein
MKFLNSKKGGLIDIMFNPVFHTLLALGVVSFILFSSTVNFDEKVDFNKRYLAKDLALTIDTLYAMPGFTYLNYDKDTMNFFIDFNKDSVSVYENKTDFLTKHFQNNPTISFQTKKFNKLPFTISFLKDNSLKIDEEFNLKPSKHNLICKKDNVNTIFDKSFLIIPSKPTEKLAEKLKSLNNFHKTFETIKYTFRNNYDIIIEFDSNEENKLIINYDNEKIESKNLACNIYNSIINNLEFENQELIPVQKSFFKNHVGNDATILINFSNKANEKIVYLIDKGIKEYYKK